jgi:predicted SAM-dependent methyltransferase
MCSHLRDYLKNAVRILRKILRLFVVYIDRESIANTYIRGNGIEIGALNNPLKLPKSAYVQYVDFMSLEGLRKRYPELGDRKLVDIDIIDDGEKLDKFKERSQDFVVANHFLEHSQNPILAIINMLRVLKVNGRLYCAVPDKRYTFDVNRQITDLEHIIKDFHDGPDWSRKKHYEEWFLFVDNIDNHESEFEEKVDNWISENYSIHFHVWTQREIVELLLYVQKLVSFEIELIFKNDKENIFILIKK